VQIEKLAGWAWVPKRDLSRLGPFSPCGSCLVLTWGQEVTELGGMGASLFLAPRCFRVGTSSGDASEARREVPGVAACLLDTPGRTGYHPG
jgi:hypothetical protein